ncbi:MAG: DinB family protein [Marinoscillum sp.]|uniref:DinB family protein n=1 Tax=Marinoscillum sp. TaxID=2024838 RepID=UPI0032F5E146
MKAFFKDIFEYQHHFNQQLVALLIREQERISVRTIPLFSHVINAHQIWNARIVTEKALGVNQLHTLETCQAYDQSNHLRTMEIIADSDLSQPIQYRTSSGAEFENTIQEILFHVSNHTTHHRGQIISDLRQHGIEPIVTDYIFYKR